MQRKPCVIFLDVDGVLNRRGLGSRPATTEPKVLPDRVALIDSLVARTGAQLVLSSSWRIKPGLAATRSLLGLRSPLDHATPVLGGGGGARGREIQAWLLANGSPSYVAIDDGLPADFGALPVARIVFVRGYVGLEQQHVARAIEVLR